MGDPRELRLDAAHAANAEDADIWRWFSLLVDENRIRWCRADRSWLVSVDHVHVATEASFDRAIRTACQTVREVAERPGVAAPPRRRVA
ncbi:hypothetical protein LFL96_29660 [Paraburkholderia sp. D15]|uniref:hypothetical protein n=1 Tax=Paraburkholderia sp. D15 TaxID=2880218 RepID=UPI0024798D41|nr:hypothetical protein [Paraburkholderia sp. D15]WGS52365.1 hypothetical protein LFL96_29660 [Paraburkholderia sp. D15]